MRVAQCDLCLIPVPPSFFNVTSIGAVTEMCHDAHRNYASSLSTLMNGRRGRTLSTPIAHTTSPLKNSKLQPRTLGQRLWSALRLQRPTASRMLCALSKLVLDLTKVRQFFVEECKRHGSEPVTGGVFTDDVLAWCRQ